MSETRRNAPAPPDGAGDDLPLDRSVGYQLRMANRAVQRYLQSQIEPHGVTLGMWYFLRALWLEDGLTQRELSQRIGTMEPTTLSALTTMERSGLVTRERDPHDRRKLCVRLTERGRSLQAKLIPCASDVIDRATAGMSGEEKTSLIGYLALVQRNLGDAPPPGGDID